MSVTCPACSAFVDARGRASGEVVRCEKCGVRFPIPRRDPTEDYNDDIKSDALDLGIHPALARRYKGKTPPGGIPRARGPDAPDADAPFPPPSGIEPPGQGGDDVPTIQLSPSLVDEGAGSIDTDSDEPELPAPLREKRTRRAGSGADGDRADSDGDTPLHRPGPKSKAPPEAMPRIPGFEILSVVGKGAMGCVYRARHEGSDDQVAIKVLAAELAARQDFVARFEREAAALEAVDHPGVVPILENGSTGELHFLVMRFVEGVSLRRVLSAGPLQPIRALEFAKQIVQGLDAAHGKKVIHRDLKPENILVHIDEDGAEKLVLVDFGLAGMGEDDPHPNLTKSRMTMGTVNYMAPEQRTDAKRVGPPADLYAAAVILYEMLTGDLPLGRFKLPTERPGLAHLPALVDDVVGRALDRDPERRYGQAQALLLDLSRIAGELEQQASRDTVVGRASRRPSESSVSGEPTEISSGEPSAMRKSSPGSGARSAPGGVALEAPGPGGALDDDDDHLASAPPLHKRPQLILGVIALIVGAAIGLLTAPGDDDDVDPTGPGAMAPSSPTPIAAAPGGWRTPPGWQVESTSLLWPGAPGEVGRAPSLAIASHPRAALPLIARAVVAVKPRPPVAPDADRRDMGYGGVFLAREGAWFGFAILEDRSCAFLRERAGKTAAEPEVLPVACDPPPGPVEATISCDAERRCALMIGEETATVVDVDALDREGWSLAYGCRRAACRFSLAPATRRAPSARAPAPKGAAEKRGGG